MPYTQDNREFQVTTPLGKDKLLFYRMHAREALGQLFEYRLQLLSEDGEIKLEDLVGNSVTVTAELPDESKRYFNGIATEFGHRGTVGDLALYEVVLRPWFWMLSQTADCQIFQEMTVPDIFSKVVKDQNGYSDFKNSLTGSYRTWEYCVQYRETDFQFLSRLLEQEGIYYFFEHEDGKHTLVLADSANSHGKMPNYDKIPYYPPQIQDAREVDHLDQWTFSSQFQADKIVLNDFDFEKPKADLLAPKIASDSNTSGAYEIFDYPGEYIQKSDGDQYSKVRLEERRAAVSIYRGAGNTRGAATGYLFNLENFPRDDQNAEYLITSAQYVLEAEDFQAKGGGDEIVPFHCELTAILASVPYRTPRLTPKPIVQGPQTAIVVGKSGEEIWVDKYGRVKVQFHWDRYGKSDENSSCWVRVSHPWAGKQWGAIHTPRIGQEVIINFLEGDPDQPIITGRVYNADNMPPYTLPDNQTQSGLKTRSTKSGDQNTFNELRFEDKKGSEEIYFHAEKDFSRVVENNDTLKVGFEKKDKGDQTIDVFNNQTVNIGAGEGNASDGSQVLSVYNNRTATIKQGNETLKVEKGNREVTVSKGNDTHKVDTGNREVTVSKGNDTHKVDTGNREVTVATGNDTHNIDKGNRTVEIALGNDTLTIKAGNQTTTLNAGKSSTTAMQGIELTVGGNSIKIDQSGITLSGTMVKITGQAQVQVTGPVTQISGSGSLQLSGGIVQIN